MLLKIGWLVWCIKHFLLLPRLVFRPRLILMVHVELVSVERVAEIDEEVGLVGIVRLVPGQLQDVVAVRVFLIKVALNLLQVILVWHVFDADISAIIIAREDVLRTEWFIHISSIRHRRDVAITALCPPIRSLIIKLVLI